MYKKTKITRLFSLITTVTMLTLAFVPAADAAVANWLAPLPGQSVTGRNVEVSVGFNTQSELKVTRVELWVNGSFYTQKQFINPESRGVVSLWWDSSKYSGGSHELTAKIYAGDKLLTTVSGTGTVKTGNYKTTVPTVTFANIKSGDVLKGKTNIKLKTSGNDGEPPLVTLLVDKSLKLLKNTPPYVYDLDTTVYPDGSHEIETFAYDNKGNKSDPAVVKVAFKNGIKQPVVASVSVDPNPGPAPSEDDGVGMSLPVASASLNEVGAARSVDFEPANINAGSSTVPVAASVKPEVKPDESNIAEAQLAVGEAVEPIENSDTSVPMAPLNTENTKDSDVVSANMAAEAASTPVISSSKNQAASSNAVEKKAAVDIGVVCGELIAPDVSDANAVKAANPKPERMAMLPGVEKSGSKRPVTNESVSPPSIKNDMKAKIEKQTALATGQIKLRDFFNELGGVVTWDAVSRTIVVNTNTMIFEVMIGSSVVKVNGNEIAVHSAPRVVDGRTVIDINTYHQICAYMESNGLLASAKIN